MQDVKQWISSMREVITLCNWNQDAAIEVIKGLVRIEGVRFQPHSKTIDAILKDLKDHFYPTEDACFYLDKLNNLRQENYTFIDDYVKMIKDLLEEYGQCTGISKVEYERRFDEIFKNGLYFNFKLECHKFKLVNADMIIEHIKGVERIIIKEIKSRSLQDIRPGIDVKIPEQRKWCKMHRSSSHDFSECRKNVGNKEYSRTDESKNKDKNIQGECKSKKYYNKNSKNFVVKAKDTISLIELEIEIGNMTVIGIVDTGSERNFISSAITSKLEAEETIIQPFKMLCANGTSSEITRKTEIKFQFVQSQKQCSEVFYIIDHKEEILILGNEFSKNNRCIYDFANKTIIIDDVITTMSNLNSEHPVSGTREEIVDKYSYSFYLLKDKIFKSINLLHLNNKNKIGCLKGNKFTINLKSNEPIKISQYPIALKDRQEIKELVKTMLQEGIIRYSRSKYASPAFAIRKPSGELRLVVDFRQLNALTEPLVFPFPDVQDQILGLEGSRIYSQIDLKSGFYHIEIDEADKHKTSFIILNEQYEFNRMAMGLMNAPRFFQREISRLFSDYDFIRIFVDDILIFSKNEEEHCKHLKIVLDILQRNNLTIRLDKSAFFKYEVKFLGLIVNKNGIKPDRKQFIQLEKYIEPKNKKQIMRLIGFLNWFRNFIPKLSEKIIPLTDMLKKQSKFKWDDEKKIIVKSILRVLDKETILAYPNINKPFILECDASSNALGSILYQEDKIIGYFSYKLKDYERNYTVMEREIYSIYLSLKHFRTLILGATIIVKTDNKNIIYKKEDITSRIARWQLLIDEYEPIINHIEGKHNNGSDFLSRCYAFEATEIQNNELIKIIKVLKENVRIGNRFLILQDLRRIHEVLGHPGANKLSQTIKGTIGKGIYSLCSYICKRCKKCQLNKDYHPFYGIVSGNLAGNRPNEKIATDIIGPFESKEFRTNFTTQKFWILTIIDTFSKYTKVFPITTLESKNACSIFRKEWIDKEGKPQCIISDQGRTYISKRFKMFAESENIKHIINSPYNPQGNGIAERINKEILFIMRIFKGKELKAVLEKIHTRLNCTYHSTIETTPSHIFKKLNPFDPNEELEINLNKIKEKINRKNTFNLKKMNKFRKKHIFKPGELILIRKENKSKLQSIFSGPFKIVEVNGRQNSVVVERKAGEKYERVNIKR